MTTIKSEVHRVTLWLKAGYKPDALDLVERANKNKIVVLSGTFNKPIIYFVPGPSGNMLEVRVGSEWLREHLPECYAGLMLARLRGEGSLSAHWKPVVGMER